MRRSYAVQWRVSLHPLLTSTWDTPSPSCCRFPLPPQVAINLPGGTFFASKELILNRITAILAAYRKYCATSSSAVSVVACAHNTGC